METGHREIKGHSWSDFPNIYEKEKEKLKKRQRSPRALVKEAIKMDCTGRNKQRIL
jgi:hypothetical protein